MLTWREKKRRGHLRKIRYRSLEAAQAAARRLEERIALTFTPLNAYACPFCRWYHVGHRPERMSRRG